MKELQLNLPVGLSEEEKHLREMYERLKNVRKIIHEKKLFMAGDAKSEKKGSKRSFEEAAVALEEVKKKIISGAITVKKVNEKNTFKRTKLLERRSDTRTSFSAGEEGEIMEPSTFSPTSSTPRSRDTPWNSQPSSSNHWHGREQESKGPTIYVRGFDLQKEVLSHAFEKFGRILRVNVDDRQKNAFVEYKFESEAKTAIDEMDGQMLNGINIRVSYARRQSTRHDARHSRREREERLSSSSQNSSGDLNSPEPNTASWPLPSGSMDRDSDAEEKSEKSKRDRNMVQYNEDDIFN